MVFGATPRNERWSYEMAESAAYMIKENLDVKDAEVEVTIGVGSYCVFIKYIDRSIIKVSKKTCSIYIYETGEGSIYWARNCKYSSELYNGSPSKKHMKKLEAVVNLMHSKNYLC